MRTAAEHFKETYLENNVIRWMSNNTVPPKDILAELCVAGYITTETLYDSIATKKVEDDAFLDQYIANRRKFGYSAEEKAEMANAFAGETVVDVFTGDEVEYAS